VDNVHFLLFQRECLAQREHSVASLLDFRVLGLVLFNVGAQGPNAFWSQLTPAVA